MKQYYSHTTQSFKQRAKEVAKAIKASCITFRDIANVQQNGARKLLMVLISVLSIAAFAQNNSYQATLEQPVKAKQQTFEELQARHEKKYNVEHELSRYLKQNPDDTRALYLYAQISDSHDSYLAIARCIAFYPNNLDYRKTRAKKLMTNRAHEAELLFAIEDLQFVNENGGEHHKTHTGIGWAYKQLAQNTLRNRRPQEIELDPFGDNKKYNEAQIAIYERRIDLFNKAAEHYQKGLTLGADHSRITKSVLPSITKSIAELEQLIKDQPNKN